MQVTVTYIKTLFGYEQEEVFTPDSIEYGASILSLIYNSGDKISIPLDNVLQVYEKFDEPEPLKYIPGINVPDQLLRNEC